MPVAVPCHCHSDCCCCCCCCYCCTTLHFSGNPNIVTLHEAFEDHVYVSDAALSHLPYHLVQFFQPAAGEASSSVSLVTGLLTLQPVAFTPVYMHSCVTADQCKRVLKKQMLPLPPLPPLLLLLLPPGSPDYGVVQWWRLGGAHHGQGQLHRAGRGSSSAQDAGGVAMLTQLREAPHVVA
jgi:hypothetical protein